MDPYESRSRSRSPVPRSPGRGSARGGQGPNWGLRGHILEDLTSRTSSRGNGVPSRARNLLPVNKEQQVALRFFEAAHYNAIKTKSGKVFSANLYGGNTSFTYKTDTHKRSITIQIFDRLYPHNPRARESITFGLDNPELLGAEENATVQRIMKPSYYRSTPKTSKAPHFLYQFSDRNGQGSVFLDNRDAGRYPLFAELQQNAPQIGGNFAEVAEHRYVSVTKRPIRKMLMQDLARLNQKRIREINKEKGILLGEKRYWGFRLLKKMPFFGAKLVDKKFTDRAERAFTEKRENLGLMDEITQKEGLLRTIQSDQRTTPVELKAVIDHLEEYSESNSRRDKLIQLQAEGQIGAIASTMGQMSLGDLNGWIDGVNANPGVDHETKKALNIAASIAQGKAGKDQLFLPDGTSIHADLSRAVEISGIPQIDPTQPPAGPPPASPPPAASSASIVSPHTLATLTYDDESIDPAHPLHPENVTLRKEEGQDPLPDYDAGPFHYGNRGHGGGRSQYGQPQYPAPSHGPRGGHRGAVSYPGSLGAVPYPAPAAAESKTGDPYSRSRSEGFRSGGPSAFSGSQPSGGRPVLDPSPRRRTPADPRGADTPPPASAPRVATPQPPASVRRVASSGKREAILENFLHEKFPGKIKAANHVIRGIKKISQMYNLNQPEKDGIDQLIPFINTVVERGGLNISRDRVEVLATNIAREVHEGKGGLQNIDKEIVALEGLFLVLFPPQSGGPAQPVAPAPESQVAMDNAIYDEIMRENPDLDSWEVQKFVDKMQTLSNAEVINSAHEIDKIMKNGQDDPLPERARDEVTRFVTVADEDKFGAKKAQTKIDDKKEAITELVRALRVAPEAQQRSQTPPPGTRAEIIRPLADSLQSGEFNSSVGGDIPPAEVEEVANLPNERGENIGGVVPVDAEDQHRLQKSRDAIAALGGSMGSVQADLANLEAKVGLAWKDFKVKRATLKKNPHSDKRIKLRDAAASKYTTLKEELRKMKEEFKLL